MHSTPELQPEGTLKALLFSTADLLEGHQLKSILPVLPAQLKSKAVDHEDITQQVQTQKDKMLEEYKPSQTQAPVQKWTMSSFNLTSYGIWPYSQGG